MRPFLPVVLLAGASFAAVTLHADTTVPVTNPGFEAAGPAGAPAGWSPADGASRDATVGRGGAASLRIANIVPSEVVVTSEPVRLKVGHLYRLSAWVRTDRALSDPTSRYPTAVPAALTMTSFPFTNHSPAVGATADWTRVETLFIATTARDAVRLHLGLNGTATGTAWFDDVALEEVDDISAYIPPETVRWAGEGYRYDDRGWIFVHIEGDAVRPRRASSARSLADEIAAYIKKLSIQESAKDPAAGWAALRLLADATMLRGFDEEFLTEMKGTADGAAAAGAKVDGRPVDLLDVVTINSAIDLGQLKGGLRRHAARAVRPHLPLPPGRRGVHRAHPQVLGVRRHRPRHRRRPRRVRPDLHVERLHRRALQRAARRPARARATAWSSRRSPAASTRAPTSTSTPAAS